MLNTNLLLADENGNVINDVNKAVAEGSKILESIQTYLFEHGPAFITNIVVAAAIFFIGRMVAGWMTKLAASAMRRAKIDDTLVKFVHSIVYWALMVFIILAVLESLGVKTTSFAALIAAAGLAVGLALQDSLSNFASGVMLILFHPFRVGDFVEAGGTSGIIEEIQIFSTVMRTPDNKRIVVPNGKITGECITNYAAHNLRRIDMEVMCGYNDNLRDVKIYLEELLASDERVLDDPAPLVVVNELADSGVILFARPWVRTSEYWDVRWSLTEQIKNGFEDRGFTIPYPTQDINVQNIAN